MIGHAPPMNVTDGDKKVQTSILFRVRWSKNGLMKRQATVKADGGFKINCMDLINKASNAWYHFPQRLWIVHLPNLRGCFGELPRYFVELLFRCRILKLKDGNNLHVGHSRAFRLLLEDHALFFQTLHVPPNNLIKTDPQLVDQPFHILKGYPLHIHGTARSIKFVVSVAKVLRGMSSVGRDSSALAMAAASQNQWKAKLTVGVGNDFCENLISAKLFAPRLHFQKKLGGLGQVELARTEKLAAPVICVVRS